ncbi:CDP-6-deoxy-delta-3,4-glucoseen reductase [Thioalkalivibrio denitrificans]|uniref:CDP-6-deoxy-delta-3,4-glucoseen reductase n=1 Tax=Thioalkalivibrio denitrificans TaxID=108003 RepID=A0A1V3NIW2_9GAMM|nr:CDP-6-deoxy-delta-3,4-glucoseen reductase [Thioalkalivibrio denitrificans]OOG25047.1 CDP-6-deoxy-delta-3,4-glucoseen reductase [Thioalkalivibrio denitrificans]
MSFRITLQPSGHEFTAEDDETVLEAGLRQGFALPYGCRNGACGSCLGRLLNGEVDYGPERPPALSEAHEADGKALFCQAVAMTDLEIEVREIGAARDILVKTLPCRVVKLERLNHDVMEMHLKLPATERLQFLAGQYIDILLRDGRHRSYSLANAPHRDEFLELHVRRVPGGAFSGQVFGDMKEKALLRLEGPLGTFFLREDSPRPILLMAGGTGFAPLKAMLEHAFETGLARPMHLFWGVRALRDLYMDALPREWAAEHDHFRYTPVLSEPLPDDAWKGETGYVHEALLRAYPDLSGQDVYMAGPPPMIQAARAAFMAAGLPEDQLFHDSFDYAAR